MKKETLISIIKSLNLPEGRYIVAGSASIAIHDLKDAHDIDIVVSPEVFDAYKSRGFEEIHYTYPDKVGQSYLKKVIEGQEVELYLDVNCKDFNPTLEELLSRKQVYEGINFIAVEDLLRFKLQYGRPKDQFDIDLIKKFFSQKLKDDGYLHIFEWADAPNTVYEEHEHKGRTAFYILRGAVTFTSGFDKTFSAGERFDVPPGIKHAAIVGPEGCDWIVAEDIEGDS